MSPPRKTPANSKPETAKEKAEKARSAEAQTRDKSRRKKWSLILFSVGILLIVFSFIGDVTNPGNMADYIKVFLRGMLGFSVFFVGPILIYISVMISMNKGKGSVTAKLIQLGIIILIISAAMQVFVVGDVVFSELFDNGVNLRGGGLVGSLLGWFLMLFGVTAARIIVVLITFIVFMLASDITLHEFFRIIGKPFGFAGRKIKEKSEQLREDSEYIRKMEEEQKTLDKIAGVAVEDSVTKKKRKAASILSATNSARNEPEPELNNETDSKHKEFHDKLSAYSSGKPEPQPETDEIPLPEEPPEPEEKTDAFLNILDDYKKEKEAQEAQNEQNEQSLDTAAKSEEFAAMASNPVIEEALEPPKEQYALPPVALLTEPVITRSNDDINVELEQNSETLVKTLLSFGVKTEIVGVCRGPSVTRYEVKPAEGVKISKITNLVDDIALNLATAGVRIEAPIPNKPAVGIEVPNRTTDTVYIRSLIDSDTFRSNDSKLAAVIGKDLSGEIITCDIAKMPHILIAGTTGSGKSVCVNSIIMSILFRATPDEVRFVMIDPKMVEFMIYNGIPHLLIPVVTDPKKAAGALGWAVTEMENRFKSFSEYAVRDIFGYNSLCIGDPELEAMPQIVIFIDEFADLMMVASGEVESSVCRLAQMGRAAGIHLVIATQRPSVDVITGIIKNNIPSRIALKVASQVDSRTIIDQAGANTLLGKGDMLFNPVSAPKPIRVQGCWVSEKEIERTIDFIKKSFTLDYNEDVIKEIDQQSLLVGASKADKEKMAAYSGDLDVSDDKLDEAIEAVIEAGQASTSYLQRKLKLGYGRAARLIDIMEQMGVVGTFEGSKPRQVIMTRAEWFERKINRGD
jgi:S-DNA-T family DNA segregation ATPase FtsK/SpoIIIE